MSEAQEGRPLLAPPLSHLPGMVFRCRTDRKRTMDFVSEGCRQVTGYGPNELVHNEAVAYGELIYERDREMVKETIAHALRERRPFQISYRIQTRVGEEKWVWEQGNVVFPANGTEVVAVEGIIVDITPRRLAASQPQRRERPARVGQMASGIAHDFKNIMSVIVLYSELLERQPEHPRRQHYLSVITQQANHASRLIGQLLDYSRNSYVEGQLLDLNVFLDEMADLLERTLAENIELLVESTLEEAVVEADSTRLQQVLLNLALNARDAMPDGGTLEITLSRFELLPGERRPAAFGRRALPGLEDEQWIRIEVTDSGSGIAPDVLPHIFEPFFTTKEAGRGTGLGLAQVDGIVEQLGGTVGVVSRLGQGTTFSIYLPLTESKGRAFRSSAHRGRSDRRSERILVVESNSETRGAVSDAVQSLGYRVLMAKTAREALAVFEAERDSIDLLVTAAQIDDMRGEDLCRRLRWKKPGLPCLLLGPHGRGGQSVNSLRQENTFSIQKPFSLSMLADTLRLALE